MNEPLKVGMVGFGISAKVFHAPFITTVPGFELVSVLERTNTESPKIYPSVRVVRSIEEMVDDKEIELVVITTPNETHYPYAEKALQAGKHVVLEKPFTNTTDEAKKLIALAKEKNRIISVYQNRRYVSDFLTIQEILNKKMLGDVHEYNAHYDRYRIEARPNAWREAPKPGSGIFYDLGSHLIDQTLYLFGLPRTITADIRKQRPHAKVDDYFDLWLDYGFLKARLHGSMLVREMGPRYAIHGTSGSYLKYGEDPQEAALRAGEKPNGDNWGKEPAEFDGLLHTEFEGKLINEKWPTKAGNFGLYYKNIYEAIRNNAPLHETPEHGHNTIRIIELAFESNEKKCSVECSGLIDIA